KDDTIEVPSTGGREPRILSRQILSEIIEPRLEEMFNLVKREIHISGYSELIASGIVLTGGSAIMDGITDLAEKIFKLPVRKGFPKGIGGLVDVVNSPMYATGVGLILFGLKNRQHGKKPRLTDKNLFDKIFNRMKCWVDDFF
ncbi:MAG: cell division FtsA domain-containing protein, partial [Nitrospinota bacterium]